MDKEDLIIDIVKDLKGDFTLFKTEVSADLKLLSKEVTKLKTSAGMIGAVSGGVLSIIIGLLVAYLK